ncbi:MAG: hypothetical protein GEU98_29000 [Pseudonocardiaceae bacterium]|nr:hypothetical protein [Pseudonocardiaceae bacterium]
MANPDSGSEPVRRRRHIDPFTLIAGLVTLGVSGYVLGDGPAWFPTFDVRWLLAGGAVLVGVLLLAGSFRPGRR